MHDFDCLQKISRITHAGRASACNSVDVYIPCVGANIFRSICLIATRVEKGTQKTVASCCGWVLEGEASKTQHIDTPFNIKYWSSQGQSRLKVFSCRPNKIQPCLQSHFLQVVCAIFDPLIIIMCYIVVHATLTRKQCSTVLWPLKGPRRSC